MKALIVVDYQNDFVEPEGALYVPDAYKVAPIISDLMVNAPLVVLTGDWHKPSDPSFKRNGGIWPVHCVCGTYGADISGRLPVNICDMLLHKTGYSAFVDEQGVITGLHEYLRANWVDELDIVGVALDHCVKQTALSAVRIGYGTRVIVAGTKAVDQSPGAVDAVIRDLRGEGVGVY